MDRIKKTVWLHRRRNCRPTRNSLPKRILENVVHTLSEGFKQALSNNKAEILLEIEKAKVAALRQTYGVTIAIALGMIAAVVALAS